MLLATVLFLFASSMRIVSGASWCYQSQDTCDHPCKGPEEWGNVSKSCNGEYQSPVNIVTKRVLQYRHAVPFEFTGYQETFNNVLKNNGHTVELDIPPGRIIKGGDLPGSYKALQLHLHWGKDGGPGSEHTIDGETFPMEMHIVHIKEKHSSLAEARKDRTGVAVLGIFFQESVSPNKNFEGLINALHNITQHSSNTTLSGVSLAMFIPPVDDMKKYYRYDGSLTTPGCEEVVVWTLFEIPVSLSKEQLREFSKLQDTNAQPMVNTYRPVQPMNQRLVFYSGGHVALVHTVLLIMSVLVSCALSLHTTG